MVIEKRISCGLLDFIASLLFCEGPPDALTLKREEEAWKGEIKWEREAVSFRFFEAIYSLDESSVKRLRDNTVLAKFSGFEEERVEHIIKRIRQIEFALDTVPDNEEGEARPEQAGRAMGMSEKAKKYPCLFGLGDCSVMARLAEDARQVRVLASIIKKEEEKFPSEMVKRLLDILQPTMTSSVGAFCSACIELKKLRGELKSHE